MKKKILKRIEDLNNLIQTYKDKIHKVKKKVPLLNSTTEKEVTVYDKGLFNEILLNSKSLIIKLYGPESPHFKEVNGDIAYGEIDNLKAILDVIKYEVENDWLISLKGILSSEIFSDFTEMAEHLLKENYKDAAAVIIGSTLESHLRLLINSNGGDSLNDRGKEKAASLLNDELYKLEIYNKLDNKNVTAWLDLRNKAAHGHYNEYDKKQVSLMLQGVRDFISKHTLD